MKRDEVVSKLKLLKNEIEWEYSLEYQIVIDEAISMIMGRKKGKWIKDEECSRGRIEPIYVCSSCRNMDAWGNEERDIYKFCPNCGAEMEIEG